MVLQIEIKGDVEDKQEELYKKKQRNYAKANYTAMKKFFNVTRRMKIMELKEVQDRYDFFLMIHEGFNEYVPFYKAKGKEKSIV